MKNKKRNKIIGTNPKTIPYIQFILVPTNRIIKTDIINNIA